MLVSLVLLLSAIFVELSQEYRLNKSKDAIVTSTVLQKNMSQSHALLKDDFWELFTQEVLVKKSWKSTFPDDILNRSLENDTQLYKDASIMKNRRKGITPWLRNDTLWAITILGACKELACNQSGVFTEELQRYHLVEAVKDFVEHIQFFYRVADIMESRGERVIVASQNQSPIHDIDKLDPIMVVGYSERFDDNKTTTLWNICVDRHVHINFHHQAHCLWHTCCNTQDASICYDESTVALREMVCDKVSRRLQKDLNGKESEDMWNTDMGFYKGLPQRWLSKAKNLIEKLKKNLTEFEKE